jgi:hypothetical protein
LNYYDPPNNKQQKLQTKNRVLLGKVVLYIEISQLILHGFGDLGVLKKLKVGLFFCVRQKIQKMKLVTKTQESIIFNL